MSLHALVSGLSNESKDILTEGLNLIYGENIVQIEELSKDNLRQRVRLSQRNVADVLVVLDAVSADMCKDIENGLFESEKFYTYTDEVSLVKFLNDTYNLDLELPEGLNTEVVSELDEGQKEEYLAMVAYRDSVIENLKNTITELKGIIEMGDYSKEDIISSQEEDLLKNENIELREQLLNIESEYTITKEELEEEISSLKSSLNSLEKNRNLLRADYDSVVAELSEYKVKYSTQTGLIRNLSTENENLKQRVSIFSEVENKLSLLQATNLELEAKLNKAELDYSKLQVDYSSKKAEIDRLSSELKNAGSKNKALEGIKLELTSTIQERDELSKKVNELTMSLKDLKNSLNSFKEENESLKKDFENCKNTIESLQKRIEEDDANMVNLNNENIQLQSKLSILETSTSRDTDIESIMSELADMRKKYDMMYNSVFSKIASFALPKGSTKVQMLRLGSKYKNIRFVFSGSAESRKGTYKCLLDEFRNLPKEKFLIVDAVSETSIDYVFEIKKLVSGIDWFRVGGGVQNYLSQTCLSNVNVLSTGLGYINDSYLLTIDWEKRLSELDNSGYNVAFYCGDISNVIGRVMHESFASFGTSMIYTHGNAIGSRALISNIRGISNSKDSIVCFYEFNNKMSKFLEIAQKTNECRVISML